METLTKESTSMNVKEVNKQGSSEELVKREHIKDTPFTMIGINREWFGAMGEYRMTEKYNNKGELEDSLRCITWNRIIQVMMVINEIKEKDKGFSNKIKTLKNKN